MKALGFLSMNYDAMMRPNSEISMAQNKDNCETFYFSMKEQNLFVQHSDLFGKGSIPKHGVDCKIKCIHFKCELFVDDNERGIRGTFLHYVC